LAANTFDTKLNGTAFQDNIAGDGGTFALTSVACHRFLDPGLGPQLQRGARSHLDQRGQDRLLPQRLERSAVANGGLRWTWVASKPPPAP